MAKTSPGDLKKEGEELKAVFAKVKKKQHNCAVLMSKDGIVVETHIKKSPEVLLKLAKKAGGMPKGAWGTMTMDGQVIIIDPINDKIPGNLTKLAKKFFSERGMKFRLEIKEPEEAEKSAAISEESEEQESSSTVSESDGDTSESQSADDPRQKLVDQLAAVQKQIDVLLADTESVMHSELVDALRTHEQAMADEKFDRAVDTIRRVEVALEDYAGIMAKKTPLQDRMAALAGDIEKVKSSDNTVAADEVATAIRGFEYALSHRDWDSATGFLDKIDKIVGESSGGETGESQDEQEVESREAETSVSDRQTTEEETTEKDTGEEENPERRALEQRFDKVQKLFDRLMNDPDNVMHSPLVDAMRSYENLMQEARYDRATDSMSRIESVLEDYAGLLAKAAPLLERMEGMAKDAEKVKNGADSEAADAVATAERGFERAVRQREWDSATVFLDKIQDHIDSFAGQESEPETDEAENDSPDETAETTDEVDPAKVKSDLVKRFANIKGDLGQLLKTGGSDVAKQARELAVAFGKQIKSDNFDDAGISIEGLEKLITEATSSPEKSARLSRIAEMKKGLDSLLSELR